MDSFYGVASVVATLASALVWTVLLQTSTVTEFMLSFFLVFTAQIVVTGYGLSALSSIAEPSMWCLASFIIAVTSGIVIVSRYRARLACRPSFGGRLTAIDVRDWYIKLSRFEKTLLTVPALIVVFLGLVNLAVLLFSAPHNWDSMTYHLARMAYYIQQGNLNHFDANYWAQVIHPKNSTILMLYAFVVSGRNENSTQLVQYVSYWIAAVSVYSMSRKLGLDRVPSLLAFLVFALITENLMQANTTQNDLLLASYIGLGLYFLFSFRESKNAKCLFLAGLSWGLAVGVKSAALLALLALGPVCLYAFTEDLRSKEWWPQLVLDFAKWGKVREMLLLVTKRTVYVFDLRSMGMLLVAVCIGMLIFGMPAGYLENYQVYGNPFGPEQVRKIHSFEGMSTREVLTIGSMNLLRFGMDFISLDGLPDIEPITRIQSGIRSLPIAALKCLGINLDSAEGVRAPFIYDKKPSAHEDLSYWGVLGFGLIWVLAALFALKVIKAPAGRVLASALTVFLLVQAYVGPYDPWRGRYFVAASVLAAPMVGLSYAATTNRLFRVYLAFIIMVGCVSACTAVLFRKHSSVLPVFEPSILTRERLEQLTANRPQYYRPLRLYEQLVPPNAIVAVHVGEDHFEYPFFGPKLTRRIIPRALVRGEQSIPDDADYLLYEGRLPLQDGDIYLGESWYLRRLRQLTESPSIQFCRVDLTAGWYQVEFSGEDWWRWTDGRGQLSVMVGQDTSAILSGDINSIQRPNQVDVLLNGERVETLNVDWSEWAFRPFGPISIPLEAGENVIEFVSQNPAITIPTDSRPLAIAVKNLHLQTETGQVCELQP